MTATRHPPARIVLRIVAVILAFISGIYLSLIAAAYVFQAHIQYWPYTQRAETPAEFGMPEMKEVYIKSEDGLDLLAWYVPPAKKDGKIVVIFHGNCCTLAYRAVKAKSFFSKGYGVLLVEYRGYGGNSGTPSEEYFYKDARAAAVWLGKRGYRNDQIVAYGNSLGSGVAVQFALDRGLKFLILEAPFTSAVDVGEFLYPYIPVRAILHDTYDNFSKIGKISPALLIVHGDQDEVIPIELGKKLFAAANEPKQFISIPGGKHGDLYRHDAGRKIVSWLDSRVKSGKEND